MDPSHQMDRKFYNTDESKETILSTYFETLFEEIFNFEHNENNREKTDVNVLGRIIASRLTRSKSSNIRVIEFAETP